MTSVTNLSVNFTSGDTQMCEYIYIYIYIKLLLNIIIVGKVKFTTIFT